MSQQQKLIYPSLVGIILLCLLVSVYFAARKRSSKKSKSPPKVVKHIVKTPPDEVLKYWTADNMQRAKPVELPNVRAISKEKQQPKQSPDTPGSSQAQ